MPRIAIFVAIAFVASLVFAQEPISRPQPWETCSLNEGKDGGCGISDRPRSFQEYLVPGAWAEHDRPRSSFSDEFQWDITHLAHGHATVHWREVGSFGTHRIRNVRFLDGESDFASVLLAESSRGIFSPLLKWAGQMPEATFYEAGGTRILVLEKNSGGNIPMVQTWAWMWGPYGPTRLDLSDAFRQAIEKVAPGYSGYDTGLDWNTLHGQTWVWSGDYRGKVGVGYAAEAWFQLGGDGLIVNRAEFRDAFGNAPAIVRWPK